MKSTNITKFKKFTANIEYQKIVDKYAKESTEILKSTSPSSGRPNRTKPYKDGWDVEEKDFPHAHRDVVWNRTNWQLTHLLENGHFITNHNALAWSPPIPHIKPTYDRVRPKFVRAMRKAEIKTKIN